MTITTNIIQENPNLFINDGQLAQFELLGEFLSEPLDIQTKSLLFAQGIFDDVQKAVSKVHSYFPDCPLTLRLNERAEESSQLVKIRTQYP